MPSVVLHSIRHGALDARIFSGETLADVLAAIDADESLDELDRGMLKMKAKDQFAKD